MTFFTFLGLTKKHITFKTSIFDVFRVCCCNNSPKLLLRDSRSVPPGGEQFWGYVVVNGCPQQHFGASQQHQRYPGIRRSTSCGGAIYYYIEPPHIGNRRALRYSPT